jgi:signal peptidase I
MNSQDSRYWGLLPEQFIHGVAVRIGKSADPYDGRIRWRRVLRKINF